MSRFFRAHFHWLRYLLSVLAIAAATAATLYFPVIGQRAVFLLFFFAIFQVATWLGRNAGILALILSLLVVNSWFLLPVPTSALDDILLLNAGFFVLGVTIIVTTDLHRRLTSALRESRGDMEFAQTVGQIGSWRLDVSRNKLLWSAENYRIFGIPRGTPLTYESFLACVHPDDRAYVDRMWQAGLRGEPYDIEHRLLVGGEVKWVRERAVLEFGKHGKLLGGFGITQDITERKQSELERQKFVSLAENSAEFIGMCDNNFMPFYANPAAMRLVGLDSLEQVFQTPVQEFFFPEDRAFIFEDFFPRVLRQGNAEVEIRFRHFKTGAAIWVLYNVFYIKDHEGKAVGLATVSRDVTIRKEAEQALLQREHELRLIMNAVPALISYLDTNFRYVRVNTVYEDWFGMSTNHIIGHYVWEILEAEAWNIVRPRLEQALAGEAVSFDQLIPYTKTEPHWVHATYTPDKDAAGVVKGIVVHVIDIEDRKCSEQQIISLNRDLQRRIAEMQVIFDTVPIGLAIAEDTAGRYIRGNPANERLLGLLPGSELSKKTAFPAAYSVLHNGRELAIEELPMQRAIRGEVVSEQIFDIRRADGTVVTLLSNAAPLFDENGLPRGAVGAFMDITALKRIEDTLSRSQAQLRLFIEQAPIGIAMFDRNMNYLVASRRWVDNFGRGCTDLSGRNLYVVEPDIGEAWKQVHRRAQAGEFLKNDDDIWSRPDGSRRWMRWAAYPWTNQDGVIGGIIISCEDTTARHQAEEELRSSEARLALIVEEVQAGYWDWDLLTGKLYLSSEWKRQIGYADDELPNCWETWESRLHPEDRDFVLAATEEYAAGRQPAYEMEFRLRHKDGSYRWIHVHGGLLHGPDNQPWRMLGIDLDITDYMKSKEISERRSEIEEAFRLQVAGQTAAAIAHELNQPLTAISSYAEVALHLLQAGNPNPQRLTYVVENTARQAQRAGQVIRQLLALLQKGETAIETFEINILIQETLDYVKADGRWGALTLEPEFAPALPPVAANRLQIQKVLINLLYNGLESMLAAGVKAGAVAVAAGICAYDPAMVQVSVRDRGKGLPDAVPLDTMFQPFFTTKAQGLGMGLAVSRALIEAHGGKMWAERNPGGGLNMHFTLPLAK